MENDVTPNYRLEELNGALKSQTLKGMVGRNKVKGLRKVCHLDVVLFDRFGYWGEARKAAPGEDASPVRCYALYSRMNKEVLLYSYPGTGHSFADNLTKARAPFCEIIGNLAKDGELLAELKELLQK